MPAETEKDAEESSGGTHNAVASSLVAAPQDDNESGGDAFTDAGPVNVSSMLSAGMVEELSGNEPGGLQGGRKKSCEFRTSERDVAVVSEATGAMCGGATRQNNVANSEGAANYAN
ncbi:hypothetical protein MRX96_047572 [Rhipicephalus microplus]